MKFKEKVRRIFQPDSPTFVSWSDGKTGETGTYVVTNAEAAIRGGRPKKIKAPRKK